MFCLENHEKHEKLKRRLVLLNIFYESEMYEAP